MKCPNCQSEKIETLASVDGNTEAYCPACDNTFLVKKGKAVPAAPESGGRLKKLEEDFCFLKKDHDELKASLIGGKKQEGQGGLAFLP